MRVGPNAEFFSASGARMMSPSSVTRGVAWTLMPTCSNVYDESGLTLAPPDAIGEKVVVRYGSFAPMFRT